MASVTRRPTRSHAVAVTAGAAAILVATGVPAFGHASFPQATNPVGTAASPYPAGTQQTLKMAVPFEQDGVLFKGADNTTTDVKITAPSGWTKASCGEARKGDLSAVVSGWACTVSTEGGRQVLHWKGAQVAVGKTSEDSAQYFTFTMTTPSPGAATTYGATGSAANGFHVVQKYADGATSTWRTPNNTTAGELANGLMRSVAAAGGSSTPAPTATVSSTPKPTVTAQATTTPRPTASAAPTSTSGGQDVNLDVLPKTGGGDVSSAWMLAGASALSVGTVLVTATSGPRRRRKNSRRD